MIVTLSSAVVVVGVGVPNIRLQTLSFRLDYHILLLVDVCNTFVVFGLLVQLGCKRLLVFKLWLLKKVVIGLVKSRVISFPLDSKN